jgi:hypothetical protein
MLWVIGQVLIAVLGMAVLIVAVVAVWYAIGLVVLSGVSRLFPLTGRRARKKER